MELCWQVEESTIYQDLTDWTWLPGLTDLRPVLVSAFADVFLHGPDGYWFLDTMEGRLTREWADAASLNACLDTVEGQDKYLMAGLAHAAAAAGIARAPRHVYVFAPAPVLSGRFEIDDIVVTSLGVALSLSGQLHAQLRGLPPREGGALPQA